MRRAPLLKETRRNTREGHRRGRILSERVPPRLRARGAQIRPSARVPAGAKRSKLLRTPANFVGGVFVFSIRTAWTEASQL